MWSAARGVLAMTLAIAAGSLTLACGAKCKCGDLGNYGSGSTGSAPPSEAGDQSAVDATSESTPDALSVSVVAPLVDDSGDTDVFTAFPEASSAGDSSPTLVPDAGSGCVCSSVWGGPCGPANGGCGCCPGSGLACGGNDTCAGGAH